MRKILIFSFLLIMGLILSQIIPAISNYNVEFYSHIIKILTMIALGFIMIHVGYEFDIDKSNLRQYGWDYLIAATAAAFPWIFCAVYFVFFLSAYQPNQWDAWKESLLAARFAAPTSAGILFSMLIAAGLGATWIFKKIRILAIFDDLDTVLLMIPLKMMIVGLRWQLAVIIIVMLILLWFAWRYLHTVKIPITWPWVLTYAAAIALTCELIYFSSKQIDEIVPIHIEVLLPAFVLGCMIARAHSDASNQSAQSAPAHHDDILETPKEKRVATIVSCIFMLLVGLTMPPIIGIAGDAESVRQADQDIARAYTIPETTKPEIPTPEITPEPEMSWSSIILHVIFITILSNLGKMFPALCYRRQARWQERLAVAIALFPRGEVGAGVLIISLSYSIGGPMITVAMLSLALNLLCTGFFIVMVKRLIGPNPTPAL